MDNRSKLTSKPPFPQTRFFGDTLFNISGEWHYFFTFSYILIVVDHFMSSLRSKKIFVTERDTVSFLLGISFFYFFFFFFWSLSQI